MIIQIIALGSFIALGIGLTIYLWPFISRLSDKEYQEKFVSTVRGYGIGGVFFVVGLFVVQTVLAVIPAGPVEIVAGLMYGVWGGYLLCMIGTTIGSLLVYFLVKLLGSDFVKLMVDLDKAKKIGFLEDERRTEIIILSLFIMPGLPKDFIAFLVPFTKVSLKRFLIINVIGRTPSTILSVLIGDALITQNFTLTIVIAVISIIVSLIGFVFNKQIVNFISKIRTPKNTD